MNTIDTQREELREIVLELILKEKFVEILQNQLEVIRSTETPELLLTLLIGDYQKSLEEKLKYKNQYESKSLPPVSEFDDTYGPSPLEIYNNALKRIPYYQKLITLYNSINGKTHI